MPDLSLPEFAATFDRAALQPMLAEAAQQRQQIVDGFPLTTFAELPLERYALKDKDRTTLCYLLEFGSPALGSMKGGSADKLGIYFHIKSGQWKCAIPGLSDVGNAWNGLRADLLTAVQLVKSGQFELIDALPAAGYTPALRTKWLHVHQPDEVLPIYTFSHLKHYIEQLGGNCKIAEGKYTGTANRQLVTLLRDIPELAGWSLWEVTQLLYAWNPPMKVAKISGKPDGCRYVKIAPGENAMFWEECLKQGVIILGWGNTGDLSQAKSLNEVKAAMDRAGYYEGKAIASRKSREVWDFVSLRAGDIIAANRGTSQILALGTVVEPVYEYLPEPIIGSNDFRHVIHVEWDASKAMTIPAQADWAFVTVQELKDDLKKLIIGPTPLLPPPTMPTLNRILYGPPGTGKTHRVIREAAAIIEGRALVSDEAKTAYDKACLDGRVKLVTFHQSFSYEDFIEGIRPVMDESGAARFEVRDGVFKEIATEALFACLEPVSLADAKNNFEPRWRALLLAIADTGELEIPGLTDAIWCLSTTEKGNLRAVNKASQKQLTCGHSAMAIAWQKLQPGQRATSMNVSQALGKGAHFGVIAAVYNYMQSISPLTQVATQANLPFPTHSSADASKGTIIESYLELGPASGWQLRADKNYPPYVLVIDEINRGNISRIFGELITLIEDDKRHGGTNALRVVLPSSREPFTVPPNLFLLGTMNTADKSLALLDVALRRRFEFEELGPDFSICESLPAPMRAALTQLNERIELRKDRDHRIGHAFFMGVSDEAGFNHAFRRKVVPLLQEYFFNDIDGARFVLGEIDKTASDGFLRPIKTSDSLSKHQRNRWRWFTDEQPDMDCWERLQNNLG